MRKRLTLLCVACAIWLWPGVLTAQQLDQQQTDTRGVGAAFNDVTWVGQTFVPGITGGLSQLDLPVFCSACVCPTSINPAIVVEVRTTSGGLPTATVLATKTITGFCSAPPAFPAPPRAQVLFTEPARLSAGTTYAFTIHAAAARATGAYAASSSPVPTAYRFGDRIISRDRGLGWTIDRVQSTARDITFKTFMMLPQQIDFAPLPDRIYGEPDFTIAATASSGLPVSFSASGACSVSGNIVHITSVRSCTITATQAGDEIIVTDKGDKTAFLPADPVTQTFAITYMPDGECLGSPGHQVLRPLAADGSTVRSQNSTTHVKFRVCDFNGVSIGTPGVVTSFELRQIVQGTVTTDVNQAPSSTDHHTAAFRWDPLDQHWSFHLSTKDLSAGATYRFRIGLDDGSSIEFSFGLR